jgi:hypothetical protein
MKFEEYYNKIGVVNKWDLEKLDTHYTYASSIFPEDIERAFVSGSSVWYFSKGYALLTEDWKHETPPNMYLMPLNIQWVNIRAEKYDFQKSNTGSSLNVTVKFKGEPLGQNYYMKQLGATGANCDELKEIIKQYLMPKLNI